jgi:hypothetical protein
MCTIYFQQRIRRLKYEFAKIMHIFMSNMSDLKRQALDAGPDLDTTTLAGE